MDRRLKIPIGQWRRVSAKWYTNYSHRGYVISTSNAGSSVSLSERYRRARNFRSMRYNAVRLRHAKSTRMLLQRAAMNPPHFLDSLHRMEKASLHLPPDFLPQRSREEGGLEDRGETTEGGGFCSRGLTRGGHETAEVLWC